MIWHLLSFLTIGLGAGTALFTCSALWQTAMYDSNPRHQVAVIAPEFADVPTLLDEVSGADYVGFV